MMNLSSLIRAARGSEPADLVYKNITMLMVTTGEWITGDLAVTGDRIVAAGPDSYEGKRIMDGTGLFAVPGFIDAHLHVESCHVLPPAFESAVLPRGVGEDIILPPFIKIALRFARTVEGLAAARSRSRSDNTPCCHSLRSRRYATPVPTELGENFNVLPVGEDIILPLHDF